MSFLNAMKAEYMKSGSNNDRSSHQYQYSYEVARYLANRANRLFFRHNPDFLGMAEDAAPNQSSSFSVQPLFSLIKHRKPMPVLEILNQTMYVLLLALLFWRYSN